MDRTIYCDLPVWTLLPAMTVDYTASVSELNPFNPCRGLALLYQIKASTYP